MKRAAALVLACLGASAVAACDRTTIQSGDARLSFDRARVQIAAAGSGFRTVDDGATLRTGDRVRVVTGEAETAAARRARLILRTGSEVVVGRQPTLSAGDAVAEVADEPLTVRSAGSTVTARRGATRIRGGLALTAGVYEGSARVASAGQLARRARAPTGRGRRPSASCRPGRRPSSTARPTSGTSATSAWPSRSAEELQAKSDGFSSQLREGEGLTPGFYRQPAARPARPRARRAARPRSTDPSARAAAGRGARRHQPRAAGPGRHVHVPLQGGASPSATTAPRGVSSPSTSACARCPPSAIGWSPPSGGCRRRPPSPPSPGACPTSPRRWMAVEPRLVAPVATTPRPHRRPPRPRRADARRLATRAGDPSPVPGVPGLPPVTPLLPPLPDPDRRARSRPVTDLVGNLLGGLLGG